MSLKIGIIGFGRFGRLWAQCLKPFGDVRVFDKKTVLGHKADCDGISFSSLRDVAKCDLLFLLVPISEIGKACKKIAPFLGPRTVVIDACSVKIHPAKTMKRELPAKQPIIATHPLFGPDSVKRLGLKGQKIVVSPVRATAAQVKTFEKILKKLRLEIIHATPEAHDLQMAKSQALVHFIGRGLSPLGLKPQSIATPDYNTLLHVNEMVNNDTWQLFFDMQNFNPYARKIRQTLLNSLKKLDHEILLKKYSEQA